MGRIVAAFGTLLASAPALAQEVIPVPSHEKPVRIIEKFVNGGWQEFVYYGPARCPLDARDIYRLNDGRTTFDTDKPYAMVEVCDNRVRYASFSKMTFEDLSREAAAGLFNRQSGKVVPFALPAPFHVTTLEADSGVDPAKVEKHWATRLGIKPKVAVADASPAPAKPAALSLDEQIARAATVAFARAPRFATGRSMGLMTVSDTNVSVSAAVMSFDYGFEVRNARCTPKAATLTCDYQLSMRSGTSFMGMGATSIPTPWVDRRDTFVRGAGGLRSAGLDTAMVAVADAVGGGGGGSGHDSTAADRERRQQKCRDNVASNMSSGNPGAAAAYGLGGCQ